MPQFEVKVSDLLGPRVAVILVIKISFFKVILHRLKKKIIEMWPMLSDSQNVTRHESKKELEKKVFLWQFLRKNEKIDQNYPLLPYLKNRIIFHILWKS